MVVFVAKRYAVREAKKWRYAVRNAKIERYAVRKGEGVSSSTHAGLRPYNSFSHRISLHMKTLPARTYAATTLSLPIRDCSYLKLASLLCSLKFTTM